MDIVLIIVVIVVVLLLFSSISIYNKLVRMRENVSEAWKAISIALEQRLRTVGGLIDTAKQYMDFEKGTFLEVTEARSRLQKAVDSGDVKAAYAANEQLQSLMPALNVQVEAYPELKSSGLMANVQDAFSETAEKIAANENYYNGSVREYNKQVLIFPNNIFAGIFGFKKAEYYQASDEIQNKVNDTDLARDLKF